MSSTVEPEACESGGLLEKGVSRKGLMILEILEIALPASRPPPNQDPQTPPPKITKFGLSVFSRNTGKKGPKALNLVSKSAAAQKKFTKKRFSNLGVVGAGVQTWHFV